MDCKASIKRKSTDGEDGGKRKKLRAHSWTDDEVATLLKAIVETIKDDPNSFEKPSASKFYEAICRTANLTSLSGVCRKVIKNKLLQLKNSYFQATNWLKSTGAGLMEEEEHLMSICPHFHTLQVIFGGRKTMNPSNYDSDSEVDDSFALDIMKQITERCIEQRVRFEEQYKLFHKESLTFKTQKLSFEIKKMKEEFELEKLEFEMDHKLRRMELLMKHNSEKN